MRIVNPRIHCGSQAFDDLGIDPVHVAFDDVRPAARRFAAPSREEQVFSVRRHHRAVIEDLGVDFRPEIDRLAPAAVGVAKGDPQIAAPVAVIAPRSSSDLLRG